MKRSLAILRSLSFLVLIGSIFTACTPVSQPRSPLPSPATVIPTVTPALPTSIPLEPSPVTNLDHLPVAPSEACLAQGTFPPLLSGLRYGVNAFLLTAYQDRIASLVQIGGYGWVRQQIHWRDIETKPGFYDWGALDQVVVRTQRSNLQLLLSIVRSPSWTTANGAGGLPDAPIQIAPFMQALASRYAGKVRAYEIWNEPNLAVENGGQVPTPAHYLATLIAANTAIKQTDPCALVLAAPLAATNVNDSALARDDLAFYQELYTLDQGAFLHAADLVALHPGGGNHAYNEHWPDQSPEQSRAYFRHLEAIRAIMQQYGDQRQSWITEVGWAVQQAPGAPPPVSLQEQADNLVGALRYTRAHYPWITGVFVWNLNFAVLGNANDEKSTFGLLDPNWSPRPAYLALQAYLQQQAAEIRATLPILSSNAPYRTIWSVVTEGKVHTPATIGADGTIYVGSDLGRFYAITPTGGLRWMYQAPGGTRTAPAIGTDGTLYVGDESGHLTALHPDGTLAWQYDLGGAIRGAPQLANNNLYVATADGDALRVDQTGRIIWRVALGGAAAASLFYNNSLYVPTFTGDVIAISSAGVIQWRTSVGHALMCAPALDLAGAQPQLLVGDFDGFLTSLNPVDGKHLWQQAVVERITSPSIGPGSPMIAAPPLIGSDGTIYLGSRDGVVTALDPRGMVRWRYKSGSDISATPVLGHDGALYVGLYDQRLLALDPRGGIRWQASVRGAVRAAPTYAADGTLYVVTIGGVVYAFTPA